MVLYLSVYTLKGVKFEIREVRGYCTRENFKFYIAVGECYLWQSLSCQDAFDASMEPTQCSRSMYSHWNRCGNKSAKFTKKVPFVMQDGAINWKVGKPLTVAMSSSRSRWLLPT